MLLCTATELLVGAVLLCTTTKLQVGDAVLLCTATELRTYYRWCSSTVYHYQIADLEGAIKQVSCMCSVLCKSGKSKNTIKQQLIL